MSMPVQSAARVGSPAVDDSATANVQGTDGATAEILVGCADARVKHVNMNSIPLCPSMWSTNLVQPPRWTGCCSSCKLRGRIWILRDHLISNRIFHIGICEDLPIRLHEGHFCGVLIKHSTNFVISGVYLHHCHASIVWMSKFMALPRLCIAADLIQGRLPCAALHDENPLVPRTLPVQHRHSVDRLLRILQVEHVHINDPSWIWCVK